MRGSRTLYMWIKNNGSYLKGTTVVNVSISNRYNVGIIIVFRLIEFQSFRIILRRHIQTLGVNTFYTQ